MHLCAYRLKVPQNALLLYPPQGEAGKGEKKRKETFSELLSFFILNFITKQCAMCANF